MATPQQVPYNYRSKLPWHGSRPRPPREFGLHETERGWELTWFLDARNMGVPLITQPPCRHRVKGHTYEYAACEALRKWPPRPCQLVHPVTTTQEMLPFITHPNDAPPVAVIPRAVKVTQECAFCGDYPVLHNVRQICPFHFYYMIGCTQQEHIVKLDGFRDSLTGHYHYHQREDLERLRKLVAGWQNMSHEDRERSWRDELHRHFPPEAGAGDNNPHSAS
ncbi:hypothetical protein F5B19DRAFT_160293 [Rostrohypoxylon terebratum]|nr:hypothetical protein F5B19DRAFT_160293 [Rostrohypoxylon terebratum]